MKRSVRKLITGIIAVCLLCSCIITVQAEETEEDLLAYFDSFMSRVGNICFSMDTPPDAIMHDSDLSRDDAEDLFEGICIGWKNKTQLFYTDSVREWQYHIADISGTIDEAREVFAGQDEMYIRGNALLHFAALVLNLSGADPAALEPSLEKEISGDVTLPKVTIDFEYDDMPGVPYRCIGLLDGEMAVLLIGNVCDDFNAMADVFGIITPEREAVIAERCVPDEEELGLLTFTMPAQAGSFFSSGSMTFACFTEAYHFITVEYMPVMLNEMLGVETVTDDDLLEFVAAIAEDPTTTPLQFETDLMQPGVARARMIFPNQVISLAEQEEVWFILMPNGCYTIKMPLTGDGDILRDTLAVKEDADVYEEDLINELMISIFGSTEE